ncbi:TonB-dependent receptor [Hyphomicrobium sp.]|uniref:TonB-dependent receptor n=1 Tax=Hyphomicrobium sp. TaxID=82 RepID=UPI002D778BD3|nr:TonB-dependent receptor [Hyphomicrobium sp.]HET6388560.1 TonB-dependent receptor [Hyphomicrobium sp.]
MLGHESAQGWSSALVKSKTGKAEQAGLGALSLGIASALLAGGASAQTAEPAETSLPPVEVLSKSQKPKKKKVAQKKAPPSETEGLVEPSTPLPATSAEGSGSSVTPASGNTLQSGTGLSRLPGTYQDTPQIVNVVSQQQIQEQNLTTIDQALRTVPGVTVSIGEGNGGFNGDQFRIRGFDAKGDLYVDGLRDFGVYVRDSFAFEQVDVLKGPSSESFGMGTTGGAINLRQKNAHLGDASSAEITVGSDSLFRSVVDVNKQINATTAARAVGMYHDQDVADRDHVYSDRWGFLGSIGFGLGTDTELHVNYLHQENDRRPDFGVPFLRAPGSTVGLPATEFGVPRSNYYGKDTDRDETTVDMLTARLTKRINPWLTISNDTRLEFFDRDITTTPATCAEATCNDPFFSTGDAPYAFGAGGGASYNQESWGIQNITTATAKLNLGGFRHEAVAGIDVFYQADDRIAKRYVDPVTGLPATKIPGTIQNPNYDSDNYVIVPNPLNKKSADATNYAFFASDRMWLTPEFSLLGGIRWDSYHANYTNTDTTTGAWNPELSSDTNFWSPKLSAIWEPTKEQTYYVSWATSASPAGQFITQGVNPIGTNPGQDTLEPEENESYEVGAKWSLLNGRLGLTAAAFRVDKANAYYSEPDGSIVQSGEEQRVQGVEIGMNGMITDKWMVAAAYTHMASEIRSAADSTIVGNEVPGVPANAASFWTTYDVASLINVPGKLLVGGGVTYAQDMFIRNDETNKIPQTLVFDGLISYEIDRYRFALNGYNLTDELYYDSFFQGSNASSSRATPGAGRSVTFTAGVKF